MDRRLANDLDNYITGHYGEDDPALKSDDDAPATPGPWLVDDEANVCADNRVILSPPAGFPSWGEAFANAELAAAAPDMLALIREFIAARDDDPFAIEPYANAREFVKKFRNAVTTTKGNDNAESSE